jgi:hypothetical protein
VDFVHGLCPPRNTLVLATLFWHDTVHPHLPRLSDVWRPLRPPGTLTSENPTFRTILGQDREFDELANGKARNAGGAYVGMRGKDLDA